jgi:hypothetical protein
MNCNTKRITYGVGLLAGLSALLVSGRLLGRLDGFLAFSCGLRGHCFGCDELVVNEHCREYTEQAGLL